MESLLFSRLTPGISRSGAHHCTCRCRLHAELGGAYRDELARRRRRWHWLPALFEIFDVKLDGFANEAQGFITRVCRGYAAWKIGDICTVRCWALFKHYQVTHSSISYFFRLSSGQPASTHY
jgi:hypothetical protein